MDAKLRQQQVDRSNVMRQLTHMIEMTPCLSSFVVFELPDKAGFVLRRPKTPKSTLLLTTDLDDTLVGYSEAKIPRLELYRQYAYSIFPDMDADTFALVTENLMNLTDNLARWIDDNKSKEMYHVGAHIRLLSSATEMLQSAIAEHADASINTIIKVVKTKLENVLTDLRLTNNIFPSAINTNDGVASAFRNSMAKPEVHTTVVAAIAESVTERNAQVCVLTYGEPEFQLLKITHLLDVFPSFPITEIWLATSPKSQFIRHRFGANVDSGNFHSIVSFEDSLDDLDDVSESLNSTFPSAKVSTILTIRPGTKRRHEGDSQHTQINFEDQNITQRDLAILISEKLAN